MKQVINVTGSPFKLTIAVGPGDQPRVYDVPSLGIVELEDGYVDDIVMVKGRDPIKSIVHRLTNGKIVSVESEAGQTAVRQRDAHAAQQRELEISAEIAKREKAISDEIARRGGPSPAPHSIASGAPPAEPEGEIEAFGEITEPDTSPVATKPAGKKPTGKKRKG